MRAFFRFSWQVRRTRDGPEEGIQLPPSAAHRGRLERKGGAERNFEQWS